jgi:hypothetical protein
MRHPFAISAFVICLFVPGFARAAPDPATASSAVTRGQYCDVTAVRAVVLEELSLSFAMVAKADKAITENEFADVAMAVASASTALELASSRGAAARTTRLIDAVIDAKSSEDNKQMVDWFPLLHTAVFNLPQSAYTQAADRAIAKSEDILDGDRDGDALDQLRTARHWLTCDRVDAPLEVAKQALGDLNKSLYRHEKPKPELFEAIYAPLRQAMDVMLALPTD